MIASLAALAATPAGMTFTFLVALSLAAWMIALALGDAWRDVQRHRARRALARQLAATHEHGPAGRA